ncbi:MAG TPA: hypothetical protein DD490_31795 [Acidobacteria bacterium]|nr:hypothetical protein [Acidobacteriota bacterium]
MPGEVIDTNVLRVASVLESTEAIETPVTDKDVLHRVFEWLKDFRQDRDRRLVMDHPERTIWKEYDRNLPRESYGRRVMVDKFTTGSVEFVSLTYWSNGSERVAHLPDPKLDDHFHDLGDRKMIAAAYGASAPIVNATDGDWSEPHTAAGLRALGIEVIQLLTEPERRALRKRP